jgi:exosortase K
MAARPTAVDPVLIMDMKRAGGCFATMAVSQEAFAPMPPLRRQYSRCSAFVLAILIAVGLKAHYSTASVDRLGWIIRPTAGLVELCTGLPFEPEAGAGYVNHERRVVVAKACAGVNFLIMVFCMLTFTLNGRAGGGRRPLLVVAAALAAAYAATVIVNGVRIMIALRHAGESVGNGWLTPEQIHRLEGIVVYFAALTGLYCLARIAVRVVDGGVSPVTFALEDRRRSRLLLFVPLGWYVAMALGVPLLNGAMQEDQALFAEHALWVLGVPLLLLGALLLSSGCWHRLRHRAPGGQARVGGRCFRTRAVATAVSASPGRPLRRG